MSNFFKNFPTIQHPQLGSIRDITARVRIRDFSVATYRDIEESIRPDSIADRYLGDASKDWILYFSNKIVNPQDMVVLNDQELTDKIVRQYGSIQRAVRTVVVWNNNWREQSAPIVAATYNNLPAEVKQLYVAKLDANGNIASYVRRRIEIFRSTNIIDMVTMEDGEFAPGELIDILDGAGVVATATVVDVQGSVLTLHHRQGDVGTTIRKLGEVTEYTVDSWTVTAEPISDVEAAYYTPVTAFDQAVADNDAKRKILVPSVSAVSNVQSELRRELQ